MENFEDFKKRIMLKINGEEEISKELINSVESVFEEVKKVYIKNQCNNPSINERIDLESGLIKEKLNKKIIEEMRNERSERTRGVMDKMQRYLEELGKDSSQIFYEDLQDIEDEMEKETRESISEIGADNEQIISLIVSKIEDILKDIMASQNKILNNSGKFSLDKIFDIQQQVIDAIKQFKSKEEGLVQILEQKDEQLREEILKEYDLYIQQRTKSQNEKDESDEFRDSLKVGISLEEQANSVNKFFERQEAKDNDKDRPKQLADELPKSIL